VRECLRDRDDLRVIEATSIAMATQGAVLQRPDLLIVDAPDAGALVGLIDVRAVVMADDLAQATAPNALLTTLARPFSGQDLQALVDRLLS
jgi:hypothetical protein